MKKKEEWWFRYPWRMIQTNLSDKDWETMEPEKYVGSIRGLHGNAIIINAGGISANYPSRFPFHHKNPFLHGNPLKEIIRLCRAEGIRVFCRVDFSKVKEYIFQRHPEWGYVSEKGEGINYHGDVHVCFNSEYQQIHAMEILQEIVIELDPDGIFMNMGGYMAGYEYTKGWQGECYCENCRRRFRRFCGEELPRRMEPENPIYIKFLEFKQKTVEEYCGEIRRLLDRVKPGICFSRDNMYREEAGTAFGINDYNDMYRALDLQARGRGFPDRITLTTSVDFLDMQCRHSSVSPWQHALRFAQILSCGGNLDMYQAGRIDNHVDSSGYSVIEKAYRYHMKHEEDYGQTVSQAKILLLKPRKYFGKNNFGIIPEFEEYNGWFRILAEGHFLFDCANADCLTEELLRRYDTLILPDIWNLSEAQARMIDRHAAGGGTVIASGLTGWRDEYGRPREKPALRCLGIQGVDAVTEDNLSVYFEVGEGDSFPSLAGREWIYLRGQYVYANYASGSTEYMRLIPPHRHSPIESAYPVDITDFPACVLHFHEKGRGLYIPWKPASDYYRMGFPEPALFLTDILGGIIREDRIRSNLPEMVWISYARKGDTAYIHLVNHSGAFHKAFFAPLPIRDIYVEIPWEGTEIVEVKDMVTDRPCGYRLEGGSLRIQIENLELMCAIKIR